MKARFLLLLGMLLAAASTASAGDNSVKVHGSVQADILVPETDAAIGTQDYKDKVLGNGYAGVGLFSRYVDAGARVEYLEHPLPGFDINKGWGLGNIFVKGRYKGFELTVGDYYEQFGSGFILRTYEDRTLGIDNSLRGARLKVTAVDGLRITALGGIQRRFWDWTMRSKVFGGDVEFDLNRYIKPLARHNITWSVGASYVLKHESDEMMMVPGTNTRLNFPKDVNAFDIRTHFYRKGLDLKVEYAWKSQDPSFFNNYTYRHGSAIMVSGAYSAKGYSLLLQAKRSDNMAFRSRRSESEAASWINNLPPFTYMHTYTLASHYPYATREAPGEYAFQGDFSYNFRRSTALGGKYGTKVRLVSSAIFAIDRKPLSDSKDQLAGTDWYGPGGGSIGELYYLDANVQIDKKLTRNFTLNLMYMFQRYNQTALEGHGGMVTANIVSADGKIKLSRKFTLRAELQYLATRQDQKDWAYGMVELSYSPWLMFSLSDEWNCGGTGNHYYMAGITGNYRNNRLFIGYGRTRAGFNCAGGVCRYMPATRGFQASYSYNF